MTDTTNPLIAQRHDSTRWFSGIFPAEWGVGRLIEHVRPLFDALDVLAGDPDQIAAYARTWKNVAQGASTAQARLRSAATRDLVER